MNQSLEVIHNQPSADGWDDVEASDRIIQGTLIRCVDGHWADKNNGPLPTRLLALATTSVLQHWQGQKPIETILKQPGQPLPDVGELNARIPQEDWEISTIDGKPRPPWQRQWVVVLLDPVTAAKFTFANGTTGARIAVENLKDQVKWMRTMRGTNVMPLVELANAPMKTKFGSKLRPHFKIVAWHELGGSLENEAPQLEYQPDGFNKYAELKARGTRSTVSEAELEDQIPF